MIGPSFDPVHSVRFDLPQGSVRAAGGAERVLLVPASALDDLALSAPPAVVEALGRALGTAIGRRAVARMTDLQGASVEEFVTQLAGEAALVGVGAWTVERWGRALVVVVEQSPLASALLAPVVCAAIEAATGRRAWCTILSRDERAARILVGGEHGVARVREWVASGVAWGDAVARLHLREGVP